MECSDIDTVLFLTKEPIILSLRVTPAPVSVTVEWFYLKLFLPVFNLQQKKKSISSAYE